MGSFKRFKTRPVREPRTWEGRVRVVPSRRDSPSSAHAAATTRTASTAAILFMDAPRFGPAIRVIHLWSCPSAGPGRVIHKHPESMQFPVRRNDSVRYLVVSQLAERGADALCGVVQLAGVGIALLVAEVQVVEVPDRRDV